MKFLDCCFSFSSACWFFLEGVFLLKGLRFYFRWEVFLEEEVEFDIWFSVCAPEVLVF